MIKIADYCTQFDKHFPEQAGLAPWELVGNIEAFIKKKIATLGNEFVVRDNIAIHRSAIIEDQTILKGPIIICEHAFIGAHAYLRSGVFIGIKTTIGPGTELKSCVVLDASGLAHFNFVGDSIVGSHANMEAGAVIANHFNERKDKAIFVVHEGKRVLIPSIKFGAVVGDGCKIGANAVLSPGTLLLPQTVVKRLELVEQQIN
jgi:UDP-N-acetylglucosamine diphosphorylase / glucose-1-phosphate thymidylyltransferase / UDP-N-acetylgalactosamine diphosphorylase / glucosamine-1-phosphate N-acetyltransferase / galactosamine-1-phosphate N-acetyltransferase